MQKRVKSHPKPSGRSGIKRRSGVIVGKQTLGIPCSPVLFVPEVRWSLMIAGPGVILPRALRKRIHFSLFEVQITAGNCP
jgi:hypothetical protein